MNTIHLNCNDGTREMIFVCTFEKSFWEAPLQPISIVHPVRLLHHLAFSKC